MARVVVELVASVSVSEPGPVCIRLAPDEQQDSAEGAKEAADEVAGGL